MRRYALVLLIGLMLGAGLGFVLGIFVYPFLFLSDVVATEKVTNEAQRPLVASGQFIHWGKGNVRVYQDLLHLESNFEVGPGPKFHVYLVPAADVTPSTAVDKTMYVDLGRLKAFKGSQNYDIPAGIDLKNYSYAVIWCEQFNVLISPARLQHVR
jgi:hypothetical protein